MLRNLCQLIASCVLLNVVLSGGMSFAKDGDGLLHPGTVVARVGEIELTAGKIIVQQGDDLQAWWRGGGENLESQLLVRERVVTNLDEAVRAELLRKAMVDMQERGGKTKAAASQPTFELMVPILQQELKTKYRIEEWANDTPEANTYVADWLSTRVNAKIMAGLMARKWSRSPERNAEAFAYWESHKEQFTVLDSVSWRQITLAKTNPKIEEFNKLFNEQSSGQLRSGPISEDTFREYGELVRSKFPHPKTHALILKILKDATVGDQHRVPIAGDLLYLKVEQSEHRPGTYPEVELDVKDKLAALNEEKVVNSIFVRSPPANRISLK